MKKGVISMGIKLPMIRRGDNLEEIILDSIDMDTIEDGDIIGITESVVARSQGNYVSIDELADEIKKVMGNPKTITVSECIYSRNRFALILKAIARAAESTVRIYMPKYDEVGNPAENHPFTGINYWNYYEEIVTGEGKEVIIFPWPWGMYTEGEENTIYCGLHNSDNIKKAFPKIFTLKDFFKDKCEWGLLGCNKSTEEILKLFPNGILAQGLCEHLKQSIKLITGRNVIVCVYGDGCFKDPVGGIWEFADPVSMPAYTDKEFIESSPKELKVKALIDLGNSDEGIARLIKANRQSEGASSMGTTPRLYRDLLASLMDLTSGSGDRCTPVILIKNYLNNGSNGQTLD